MLASRDRRCFDRRVRTLIAAVCLVAVAILPGCSKGKPPNSLFDAAGYHVRDGKVFYLEAFPGKASEIDGADAASFETLDRTFARDRDRVYVDGRPLDGADPARFALLDREGFARDDAHVYRRDQIVSDDPAHFAFLDGDLTRDSAAVYWGDGSVLSEDPDGFAIISNVDHYLFTKDGAAVHVNGTPIDGADPATFRVLRGAYAQDARGVYYFTGPIPGADPATFGVLDGPYAGDTARVYWMGKPIDGADPATFRVLNAAFECSADAARAYYRDGVISGADPATFPDRAVTTCSETSISFAE